MAGQNVDDEVPLPGFRFHPTDEELVGFYLARLVDGRPARIDRFIKHVDIYKYDPWDLPKANEEAGDTECLYFFCMRGRKYNNSVRPNRVTGTGFWKATGIDKPVHNNPANGDSRVIGLKKTLVYYCGSAAKGTKTDWMMNEFRLPPADNNQDSLDIAEVWTVCKIFRRSVMQKWYASGGQELTTNNELIQANQNQCQQLDVKMEPSRYTSFGSLPRNAMKAPDQETAAEDASNDPDTYMIGRSASAEASCSSNNCITTDNYHGFAYDDWDELRTVVGCAFDHHPPLKQGHK